MGGKRVMVVAEELQAVIDRLENAQEHGKFDSLKSLFQSIADTDWAKSIGLKPQNIMVKIRDFGLHHVTTQGKRGRPPLGIRRPGEPFDYENAPTILIDYDNPGSIIYNGKIIHKGDRIRVRGGPYYITNEGEKIYTGEKGVFIYCSYVRDGIFVRKPDELCSRYIYMGEPKVHEVTNTQMRAHRLKLLKQKVEV